MQRDRELFTACQEEFLDSYYWISLVIQFPKVCEIPQYPSGKVSLTNWICCLQSEFVLCNQKNLKYYTFLNSFLSCYSFICAFPIPSITISKFSKNVTMFYLTELFCSPENLLKDYLLCNTCNHHSILNCSDLEGLPLCPCGVVKPQSQHLPYYTVVPGLLACLSH